MRDVQAETNAFLEARGIEPELAASLGLRGVVGKTGAVALEIPFLRRGEQIGRKFRFLGEKGFTADKGWERDLWNVDALYDDTLAGQPVVITEGELDAVACIQAGYVRSVSIPDGWTEGLETETGGSKMAPLLRNEAALRSSPVIVAADNDPTGRSFLHAVSNLLEGCDVRWAEWPDGCKDPNDVLREHGEGRLSECLLKAKRIDPTGVLITGLSDLPPKPERRILRAGRPRVDKAVALEVGAMSVLTGIPGMGKSTFALWLAHQVSTHENIRVGVLMMETHQERIRRQLLCLETGWAMPVEKPELIAKLDHHWRIAQRQDADRLPHDLSWLKRVIHTLAIRDQCKLVVIDPWNELEHFPEQGESMTQYINAALTAIRRWAEQYGCHVMLVAHPRKIPDEGRPPLGYDVADSAAFFNKPALGLTVHRAMDEARERFKLINWKVRDAELYGVSRGQMELDFDAARYSYMEV